MNRPKHVAIPEASNVKGAPFIVGAKIVVPVLEQVRRASEIAAMGEDLGAELVRLDVGQWRHFVWQRRPARWSTMRRLDVQGAYLRIMLMLGVFGGGDDMVSSPGRGGGQCKVAVRDANRASPISARTS